MDEKRTADTPDDRGRDSRGARQAGSGCTGSGASCGSGGGALGSSMRGHRRRLGLSLQQLAERVGCAKSYLSAIETGRRGAPSEDLLARLEAALFVPTGDLVRLAAWGRVPGPLREQMFEEMSRARRSRSEEAGKHAAARRLREILDGSGMATEDTGDAGPGVGSLDSVHRSGELRRLIDELDPPEGADSGLATGAIPIELPFEVPLINKVTAGYPAGFTDLGFPARVADDYVRCPDLHDPDAFAARVVGDSMEPDYREGDIVVFSPGRPLTDGDDCFARLADDDESTFKRVYFETEGERERIRLQPINSRYPPRVFDREEVAGLYRAVKVMREV